MRLHRPPPSLLYALGAALSVLSLSFPALAADGLGPGGYRMLLILFCLAILAALLVVVGLIALVVWLVRRRRR